MIHGLQNPESQMSDPINALLVEDTITAMLREKQMASECDQDQPKDAARNEFASAESAGMAANLPNLMDGAALPTEDPPVQEPSPRR